MANVNNFTLNGIGSNVKFGKSGGRIKFDGTNGFVVRNGADSANATLIVATPTLAGHATTKGYVDALVGSSALTFQGPLVNNSGTVSLALHGTSLAVDGTSGGLKVGSNGITNEHIATNSIDSTKITVGSSLGGRVIVSGTDGRLESTTVTVTEVGYLSEVTSDIQAQLNGKLGLAGGTVSGEIHYNGTPTGTSSLVNKQYVDALVGTASAYFADGSAILLDGTTKTFSLQLDGPTLSVSASGVKVATGGITNAEIAGTAAIGFDKMAALGSGTAGANKVAVTGTDGRLVVGTVTTTELDHLTGVTAPIQTQLDGKLALTGGTLLGEVFYNGTPTVGTSIVNKAYVDSAIQAATAGLDTKSSVRAATTGNVTLSGEQTIDTVALVAGDRVLVKNQTNPVDNGIYIVAAGAWTRATDMDEPAEVTAAYTFVEEGTQSGKGFVVVGFSSGDVIGVNDINWTQFSATEAYTAGNGLSLVGSEFAVVAGTNGGLSSTAGGVAISVANLGTAAALAGTNALILDQAGTPLRVDLDTISAYIASSSVDVVAPLTINSGTIGLNYSANNFQAPGGTLDVKLDATGGLASAGTSGLIVNLGSLANAAVISSSDLVALHQGTDLAAKPVKTTVGALGTAIQAELGLGTGNGSVTSIVAGNGLTGGTISTSGTIAVQLDGTASGLTVGTAGLALAGTVAGAGLTLTAGQINLDIADLSAGTAVVGTNTVAIEQGGTTVKVSVSDLVNSVAQTTNNSIIVDFNSTMVNNPAPGVLSLGTIPSYAGKKVVVRRILLQVTTPFSGNDVVDAWIYGSTVSMLQDENDITQNGMYLAEMVPSVGDSSGDEFFIEFMDSGANTAQPTVGAGHVVIELSITDA